MSSCSCEPLSLSTEDRGSGLSEPAACVERIRSWVISSAVSSASSRVRRAENSGSSRRVPVAVFVTAAYALARARLTFEAPIRAIPVRSLPRRNFAYVHPLFSSPTRLSTGTSTLSKKTSLTSWPPSMSWIGRTVTPGDFMSMRRNEIPACFFTFASVRTSMKIQSPYWPSVVHVFCPLTMYLSPDLTAEVAREARSDPALGSENPCDHQMSMFAVAGRNRSLSSCEPKFAMTGPTMETLKGSGEGTQASCISSSQMWRWTGVQS